MDNALQQAIAARSQTGVPTPQLSQTQEGAPAPMPPAPSVTPPTASGMSAPQPKPQSEEEIITKALIQRQKMLGNMKKESPSLQSMPIS